MKKNKDNIENPNEEYEEELTSRSLTAEEKYYYERSYKEPIESIARIEETAKFLTGVAATMSGLFLVISLCQMQHTFDSL